MSSNQRISIKIKDPSGKENDYNIQLVHLIFEKGDNKVITFTEPQDTNPIIGNYTQIQLRAYPKIR